MAKQTPNNTAYITFGDKPCIDPLSLYRYAESHGLRTDHWRDKANSFTTSLGREPGRGWVLMKGSDLAELQNLQYNSSVPTTDAGTGMYDLRFLNNDDTLVLRKLLVLKAHAVYGSRSRRTDPDGALIEPWSNWQPAPDSIYLVELVDKRFIACRYSAIDKHYNHLRVPRVDSYSGIMPEANSPDAYRPETLKDGTDIWTWETMLEDIWSTLPVDMGASPIRSWLLSSVGMGATVPMHYTFSCRDGWEVFNDMLEVLGMWFGWNPLSDCGYLVPHGSLTSSAPPEDVPLVTFSEIITAFDAIEHRLLSDSTPLSSKFDWAYHQDNWLSPPYPARKVYFGNWTQPNYLEPKGCQSAELFLSVSDANELTPAETRRAYGMIGTCPLLAESNNTLVDGQPYLTEINNNLQSFEVQLNNSLFTYRSYPLQRLYSGLLTTSTFLPNHFIHETVWADLGDGLCTEIRGQACACGQPVYHIQPTDSQSQLRATWDLHNKYAPQRPPYDFVPCFITVDIPTDSGLSDGSFFVTHNMEQGRVFEGRLNIINGQAGYINGGVPGRGTQCYCIFQEDYGGSFSNDPLYNILRVGETYQGVFVGYTKYALYTPDIRPLIMIASKRWKCWTGVPSGPSTVTLDDITWAFSEMTIQGLPSFASMPRVQIVQGNTKWYAAMAQHTHS